MSWTIIGESVTGTSHQIRNVQCQDAFRFRTYGPAGEWLVIAAADGAGSASHSEIGANLACDEFVRRVEAIEPKNLCSRDVLIDLFSDVRKALLVEAELLSICPRQLACTALLAVVGPAIAMFAQVGDGAIVFSQGHDYEVAFWPEPAEYANTTDFLTDDYFGDLIKFVSINDSICEVAAFTDGLQRLALDFTTRMAYPNFFGPFFNQLRATSNSESLAEPFRLFLDSNRVNERTDDDKTLVLAVRHL